MIRKGIVFCCKQKRIVTNANTKCYYNYTDNFFNLTTTIIKYTEEKMKIFNKIKLDFKQSIYTKVLMSILAALLLIIFLMEMSNFYVLNQYRDRAEELYQNSLDFYSGFWTDKFNTINKSLISIVSYEGGTEYNNICEAEDSLIIETSKIQLFDKMIDISGMHENKICVFSYVPDRNIFLRSAGHLGDYAENLENQKSVKAYINNNPIKNSNEWKLMESNGTYYFINIYHMFNGYVGAYIDCRVILEDLLSGNKAAETVAILDNDENILLSMGNEYDTATVFENKLGKMNYSLAVIVSNTKLYSERDYLWLLTVSAMISGIIVILTVIRFQKKVVFDPLNHLKYAMEAFSIGQTQLRLNEYPKNNEIKILYQTFNHMAEQIMNLKIDIYENMLEKQKIQSSYLRVQIQPHFYTNVLNLIYGLAEIQDYKSIQELSVYMSRYFRYLLSTKKDLVILKQEIDCIEDYVKIQKIRYPDCLEIHMEYDIDNEKELIPPLLLQTFIENSIKHNITLVSQLLINLQIKKKNGNLFFLISDTGTGFSKEILRKIETGEDIEENGKYIGIMNVKNRLKLLYQNKAKIRIVNKEEGSTIFIRIPENRLV